MSLEVFCFGELGIDNIIRLPHLPSPERAAFPTADSYHIGGAAANTAVWLAGWGIDVALSGNAIGCDEYGQKLVEWLGHYASLDQRWIDTREDISTPFCRIMVTPDAERTILVYGYPQTPKTKLAPEMLNGARHVAIDLYGGEERVDAARVARATNVQTAVGDVVWLDHPILPLTDIATNSAAFIRENFPGVDVIEHARRLQSISNGIVITTDGPHTVHVIDRDGQLFHVEPPEVEAVDATGAGDAFRAGVIFGLLQDWSLSKSVCFGAAAGALKVQRVGGASEVASREEVETMAQRVRVGS